MQITTEVYVVTVAMQRSRKKNTRCLVMACKHVNNIRVIAKQLTITTILELLVDIFSVWPTRGYITRTSGRLRETEGVQLWDFCRTERISAGEAEESSLLTSVTSKRLLNTLRAGEDLVFATVIYKVWRSTMVL
jgi:hypothetical protein